MVKRSYFLSYLWRSMSWNEETFSPLYPEIETLCRNFESELAKDIAPVIQAYNEGRISASELILELNSIDDGNELIYQL